MLSIHENVKNIAPQELVIFEGFQILCCGRFLGNKSFANDQSIIDYFMLMKNPKMVNDIIEQQNFAINTLTLHFWTKN